MIFTPSSPRFDPWSDFEIMDDFTNYEIGASLKSDLLWNVNFSGGAVQSCASLQFAHPGLVQLVTGIIATQFSGISLMNTLFAVNGYGFGLPASLTLKFGQRQIQAAAANVDQRLGLGTDPTAAGEVSGCFFRAVGNGNLFAVCRQGAAETAVDTGVPQQVAWIPFVIKTNSAGNSVSFWMNNVAPLATITTNLPTGRTTIFAKIDSTGASANEMMYLDYVFAKYPVFLVR
jgi:hypothetical protein